ncbi:Asp-tRNA(Asn)/Glu-tRNA(Gln) amidotransferase subunit GatC [Candidatus Nomurabacteria bacterium]|nr:Asp-tRNA(Asn)/Glu-tRNA(Gln) amidotransferase subunit GatC [Candidatus Nomurabacteria bacterium]
MNSISRDDVLQLAALSSLSLQDDEIDSLRADLSRILHFVEKLSELDTTGVKPTYQVTGLLNVSRPDEVSQPIETEVLLSLAKETNDNQIKVPKVL